VELQQNARLVEDFFQSDAPFWKAVYERSDVFSAVIQRRHRIALGWIDRLALPPGTPVLEVGCGAGGLAVTLAQQGAAVHAIDAVPAMVAQTRRRAMEVGVDRRLTAQQGDVHALAFEDATFELVVALGVLPWLHTPIQAVAEMARVLRPGGWVVLSADSRYRLVDLLDPWRNPVLAPLKHAVKRMVRGSRLPDLRPRADRLKAVDRMLARAGLHKLDGVTCGFAPLTLFGHRLFPDRRGLELERRLQALADRGFPGLRLSGWHYLVLARKLEP
jgi:ubiquinone/menaquinone biosynthesis C-methylase UbiE